jgi:molecular chaperone DnaK (HSP70)
MFPSKVILDQPRLAVVQGAALYASRLKSGIPCPQVDGTDLSDQLSDEMSSRCREFIDICPLSIGIEIELNRLDVLIQKDTPIPCSGFTKLRTSMFDQTVFVAHVYKGERTLASENHWLGMLKVTGIPPGELGQQCVTVKMEIDQDGVLHCAATTSIGIQHCELLPFRLDEDQMGEMHMLAVHYRDSDDTQCAANANMFTMRVLCKNIRAETKRKEGNVNFQRKIWRLGLQRLEAGLAQWENEPEIVPTDDDIQQLQEAFQNCYLECYHGVLPLWLHQTWG